MQNVFLNNLYTCMRAIRANLKGFCSFLPFQVSSKAWRVIMEFEMDIITELVTGVLIFFRERATGSNFECPTQ